MLNVLLVDDEQDIIEINSFCAEEIFNFQFKILQANSGNAAIEILKNEKIDICICDHNMPNGNGGEVCNYISNLKLNTKFILCSSVLPNELPSIYSKEKVFFNIVKPDNVNGFQALNDKLSNEKIAEVEIETSEKSLTYIPIKLMLLNIIEVSPVDIYISLSKDKFLKYLSKGDVFDEATRIQLEQKNIQNLYVLEGKDSLAILAIISTKLILKSKNNTYNCEKKVDEIYNLAVQFLSQFGINDEQCELSKEAIKNSMTDLNKFDQAVKAFRRHEIVGDYPTKLYVLQSILLGLIAKKFTWCNENQLKSLLIASFYQDLGLDSEKLMKITDYIEFEINKDSYNSSEVNEYLKHPQVAKEIILKNSSIPESVSKIIYEQHEMPNGEGFPKKLNYSNIGHLSALFILTGVVSRKILSVDEVNTEVLIKDLEKNQYNIGNFKDCFNEIRKVIAN